jgi:hypothetical protein
MFGPNAHPLFIKNLEQKKDHRFRVLLGDPYSLGMISYYLHGVHNWYTKVNIYNYLSLLADTPIPAEYEIICHNRDGKVVQRIKGLLGPYESIIVNLKEYKKLDEYGILHVHIRTKSPTWLIKNPYNGVFFTEYYIPGSQQSIFAHSLGNPNPSHYSYSRLATSLLVPPGFDPHLLIGNGCSLNRFLHPSCGGAILTFINSHKKELKVETNNIPPLGSHMLDLFKLWPNLREHIGTDLFSVRIEGQNIISKPYMFQWNGKTGWGEHL